MARRPVVSDDHIVYLLEHEYDVGDVSYPTTNKKPLLVLNPTSRSMQ